MIWRYLLLLLVFCLPTVAFDDEEEIKPWHLYEDPSDYDKQASVVARSAEPQELFREEHVRSRLGRYSFPSQQEARKREPNKNIFVTHAPPKDPKQRFGANRPPYKGKPPQLSTPYTVAVYYYPWYNKDFHGRKYIRGELNPPQLPVLGEYNDRDPLVISQHVRWSKQAGVNLWVTSWWGEGSGTDVTTKNVIMNHDDLTKMGSFCLFYETMGRVDVDTLNTTKVYDDVKYAAKTYFGNKNYHQIQGRPVLFVYLTRSLDRLGILQEVIAMMRTAAYEEGHLVYIVGDHTYGKAPKGRLKAFDWLDAVTNYDIFGDMGRPSGHAKKDRVKQYSKEQSEWRKAAHAQGCAYIPGATPGYNDKAVRVGEYNAMSRKLDRYEAYGTLFKELLREAKKLVDKSTGNTFVVNSWNEWHEDTQVEPVKAAPRTYKPWYLTRGYVYQAYGEQYLDILRAETRG